MEDAGCREAVRPSRSLRPQAERSVNAASPVTGESTSFPELFPQPST